MLDGCINNSVKKCDKKNSNLPQLMAFGISVFFFFVKAGKLL